MRAPVMKIHRRSRLIDAVGPSSDSDEDLTRLRLLQIMLPQNPGSPVVPFPVLGSLIK